MKAIILGAGGPSALSSHANHRPKCMLLDPKGVRVLDWILSALRHVGVQEVAFVGGYRISEVGQQYPGLRFYYNPKWAKTGVLTSLLRAEQELAGGFWLSYADIVFRPAVAEALRQSTNADVALVVDTRWLERPHNRSKTERALAEKVVVRGGRIVRIGKHLAREENATGEFIGLAWFSAKAAAHLSSHYHRIRDQYLSKPFHEADSIRHAFLTDMLQELIDLGLTVTPVEITDGWAEINTPQDLAQFVFGTKAETLERLQNILTQGRVCDQVRFTIDEWQAKPAHVISKLQLTFGSQPVVVRSSALSEDAWTASLAGVYRSILGVSSGDADALRTAITSVIESYNGVEGTGLNGNHQVFVQPQVQDVALSGVLLTSGLDSGAPYFIINYDDTTSRTDTITSGHGKQIKTLMVYAQSQYVLSDPRLQQLVEVARELEVIVGYGALDVEFAIDRADTLFILQVRPITVRSSLSDGAVDIGDEVAQIRAFVYDRMQRIPYVHGGTTIFGDMTDWNPAEMIGTRPNPLALSLYQYLITDHAWCEARARIGYFDVFPERLMVSLAGHPYIDVRNSFNNLTPAAIPHALAERLVDHYLRRLRAHPDLHDKVEFDIVITCLTFDFERHADRLRADGFSADDIAVLRAALFDLTDGVLSGRVEPIDRQLGLVRQLTPRRQALLALPYRCESIPRLVTVLLDDCIRFGTVPFSILARYAFIGSSLLRSLRERSVLTSEEYYAFLESIQTVVGDLVQDVSALGRGTLARNDFLDKYGHLRPGTYDLLSYSYEERPELYLPQEIMMPATLTEGHQSPRSFEPNQVQSSQIAALLDEYGFSCSVSQLLGFIRQAIAGREYAKFEFTRNVSRVLSLLAEYGKALGFSREEVTHLDIRDIVCLATDAHVGDLRAHLRQAMEEGIARAARWRLVQLPQLITSVQEVEVFELAGSRPNFVTSKQIIAPAVTLDKGGAPAKLTGKIVLIESADPGFDWIFMHGIGGLITMYGGAASHMAIRCAEFGLPAAIGCGEVLFDRLRGAHHIELNCGAGYVRPV